MPQNQLEPESPRPYPVADTTDTCNAKPAPATAKPGYRPGDRQLRGRQSRQFDVAVARAVDGPNACTYDATKGTLRTHLLSQLRGLQRIGARQQQVISVPERVSLDRQRLITAETELRDRFGRDPSDAEIADYTGLSLKRLAHVRQGRPPVAQGTITDSGNPDAFTPASRIPGQDPGYAAWIEFVYGDLDPINQAIMDYAGFTVRRESLRQRSRDLGLTAAR